MVKITKRSPPLNSPQIKYCRAELLRVGLRMNISIVRVVQKWLNLPHRANLLFVGCNLVSYPTVCHMHLYSNSSQ